MGVIAREETEQFVVEIGSLLLRQNEWRRGRHA
jgi:hypothetical protein